MNTSTPTSIQNSVIDGGADGDGSFCGGEAHSPCLNLPLLIYTIPRQDRRSRVLKSHGTVMILEGNPKILRRKAVKCRGGNSWDGLAYGYEVFCDLCLVFSSQAKRFLLLDSPQSLVASELPHFVVPNFPIT
jgi:hypothetical protein